MTRKTFSSRRLTLGAALLAAAIGATSPVAAQAVRPDARWQGWLGCWQPVTPASADSYTEWMATRARDAGLPTLCIVPSSSETSVDFVTVSGGKVTAREKVDAGNPRVARQRDSCDGWDGANWSADGRRIYVHSEYACGGGVTRTSSGLLTMSAGGQLLDIEEIASGGAQSVHVARYESVHAPAGFALDSALVLPAGALPVTAARTAMAGSLTGADIVDATRNADSLVVEAWLVERGDRFNIDAKHLIALADAGVPGRITDLMIALSYPDVFVFDRSARLASVRPPTPGSLAYSSAPSADPFGYRSGCNRFSSDYGPFGYRPLPYAPLGYAPLGYGSSSYSPYGCSSYGYNGYGYNGGYGNGGYGYGYLYQPPVVIVRGSGGSGTPHGRVVNGHGYTRDTPPSGTGTADRTPSKPASSGARPSGAGSSNGGTGSTSAEGETRHAKPRP